MPIIEFAYTHTSQERQHTAQREAQRARRDAKRSKRAATAQRAERTYQMLFASQERDTASDAREAMDHALADLALVLDPEPEIIAKPLSAIAAMTREAMIAELRSAGDTGAISKLPKIALASRLALSRGSL